MQFDFSHLYRTETVDVKAPDGKVLFTATVREITHSEKTAAQSTMMAKIEIPLEGSKQSRKKQYKQNVQRLDKAEGATNVALREEIACIVSWTLTDAKDKPVPVCMEAWRELPAYLSDQIVKAIERLNPEEIDEEFPGSEGNGSANGKED